MLYHQPPRTNIQYPNPPSHYKDKLTPPNDSILDNIDTIIIFGKTFQVRKIEEFTFSNENEESVKEKLVEISNETNDFDLLRLLLKNLKLKYIEFLKVISFKLDSCETTLREMRDIIDTIQTIIFKLKNKQVLIKTKNYISDTISNKHSELKSSINNDIKIVMNELKSIIKISAN